MRCLTTAGVLATLALGAPLAALAQQTGAPADAAPEAAPEAASPEAAPEAAGPEAAPEAASPEAAPEAASPEAAPEAAGPEASTETPSPEAAPEAAGPEAGASGAAAADYDAGTVLARVDGAEITLGHVVALRERLPGDFQGMPDAMLLDWMVEQLVDQQILAASVSEAAEDDPLAVRLHLENERRGTLAQLAVRERIAEGDDEEAAVEAAYAEAVAGFAPETEWNASHIIVPTEEEAAALKEEVDGGADFAGLAREHSQDGAAESGGELGWFGAGRMVPEFEAAVAEMEPGEVAGPIQTQFGWHLVRLNETRQTEPPALDAVRPQILEQVRRERLAAEIESLRAGASIERPEAAVPPEAIRDGALLEN